MSSANEGNVAEGEPRAWVAMPSAADIQHAFEGHPYNFGFVPGMGRLLATHPRIAAAFGPLYAAVMFSPEGALTRQEREMVACAATTAQDCFY